MFLYYIETNSSGSLLGNRIYRYEWDAAQKMFVNPPRVLDLPAILGPIHNGGKMMVRKNCELFATIDDLNRDGGPLGNKQSGEIDDTRL